MNIGILSRSSILYSTGRLAEAARVQGHKASVIDTTTVAVEIGLAPRQGVKVIRPRAEASFNYLPVSPALWGYEVGIVRHLPPLDGLIPRIGASITTYGVAVVQQLTAQGIPTTATAAAIAQSRDKLQSLQLMSQAGLPIPKTAVVAQPEALYSAISAVGNLPVVVKRLRATQGNGVVLVADMQEAANAIEAWGGLRQQALVQEFIPEAAGRDVRVIVVGGRCIAAMERRAAEGEFRSNLHLGGTAVAVTLTQEMETLAVAAARVHGLSVAGVDLIQSKRGYLVLEVNSSPGLEGIEGVTAVDVAGAIVTFLGKAMKKRRKR